MHFLKMVVAYKKKIYMFFSLNSPIFNKAYLLIQN